MRQRALRLTLLMLVAVIFTSLTWAQPRPATSVPVSRLGVISGLAAYVPSDALFYASARTDADALAALNTLLADISADLPGITPPPIEGLIGEMLNVPFEDIQPWLDEGIAIAGIADDSQQYSGFRYAAVLQVTDPAAAEAFLQSRGIQDFQVSNDVMVLGEPPILEALDAGAPSLLSQPAYITAIESFESRSYAGIVYADLPLLIARQQAQQSRYYGNYYGGQDQAIGMAAILRMFGPVAVGFTRAADGDLLMDVVVTAGNLAGIAPLGLNLQPAAPANPRMLALVPPDAFAVVQGSNLSGGFVELYRAFGPMLKDAWLETMIQEANRYGYTSPAPYALLQETDIFTLADLVLGNMLGLTLADLQNWSSRDYVMFTRLNPEWPSAEPWHYVMPVEMAGVFRVGRPEQSVAAFEKLARTLQLWHAGASVSQYVELDIERTEDTRALFVTAKLNGSEAPGVTIALYVTGEFAILGAEGAAEAALARLENGEIEPWLAQTAANFQPDSMFNGVANPAALTYALDAIINNTSASDQIRPFLAKLDTLTFNLRVASNGATVMRFAIGLNDAGGIETALGRPTLIPPPTSDAMFMFPTPTPFIFQPESTVEVDPIISAMTATSAAATIESSILTATANQQIMMTVTANALPGFDLTPTAPLPEATVDIIGTDTLGRTPTFVPTPVPTLEFPTEPVIAELWNLPSFRGEDGAFVLGDPNAPTTLVVFSDWACPHCQNLAPVIDAFIASDIASGAVNLEHRTLITAGGDATRVAAILAECFDNQKPGAFWSASPVLYGIAMESPDVYNDPAALSRTLSTMFDVQPPGGCIFTATQIVTDQGYAAEIGANYTPYVAVRHTDGTLTVVNDRTLDGLRAAVYGEGMVIPVEATPTPTPFDQNFGPTTDPAADATRAADLANMAATQAAGQPTATPTP